MRLHTLLATALLSLPLLAQAGVFSVTPIRIDVSPTNKAGSVSVSNEGGPLTLKTSLMRWTQDEAGADRYEASTDLVYFPRDAVVPPQGTRVVRAALNVPAGDVEQAYRLYIEEVQPSVAEETKASKIAVLVRFGVPVFIAPKTVTSGVRFEAVQGADGSRQVRLVNSGTVHLYLKTLNAPAVEFGKFAARYLLPGAGVSLEVTKADCAQGAPAVAVEAEEGTFSATLPDAVCAR